MYGLMSKRYKHMSQCLFVPFALTGKVISVGPSMIWCWLVCWAQPGLNWCVQLEVLYHHKSEIGKHRFWTKILIVFHVLCLGISSRTKGHVITYLRTRNWLGQSSTTVFFGSYNLLVKFRRHTSNYSYRLIQVGDCWIRCLSP